MFKTKVGYSIDKDAFNAAVETAKTISSVGNIKLTIMCAHREADIPKIIEGTRSILKNKPIIGFTSNSGIMVQDGYIKGDSYIGMYGFSDDDLIVGVASSESEKTPREVGKRIAREAITNAGIKKVPSYFYMVASPKDEEEYLKGIEDVIGTVPFFGGSADTDENGNCTIICNDKIIKDGCAIAFFFGKNECKNVYTGAYSETINAGVVTKLNGKRVLMEIDRTPALTKYAEWNGLNVEDLLDKDLVDISSLHPFGVKDPIGRVTAIREPLHGNNDYSITVSNDLALGIAVINMENDIDNLIKANGETLRELNQKMKKVPVGYFLIHSQDRLNALGDRKEELLKEIKDTIGEKEFMMIFTKSEYGSMNHSASTCGSLTLSFTSFSE